MDESIQPDVDATLEGPPPDTAPAGKGGSWLMRCVSPVVDAAFACAVVVAYVAGAYGDEAAGAGAGD